MRAIIRMLGVLLGALFIVVGVFAILYFDEFSIVRRILGGIAIIAMGSYFVHYGITGRQVLFVNRRRAGEADSPSSKRFFSDWPR
jgi:hypothetical protein